MLQSLLRALRRRLALKLGLTLVGFVALIEIVVGLYLFRALEAPTLALLESRLVGLGRLLEDDARILLSPRSAPEARRDFALRALGATGARVTLILPDGTVVAESARPLEHLGVIENQRRRPEVELALWGGIGRNLRLSPMLGEELFYVALPVRDGMQLVGVLRLALPRAVVVEASESIRGVLLVAGLLALGLGLVMALFVARRVTRPLVRLKAVAREMAEGNFSVRAPVRSQDEIGTLGRVLDVLVARLRHKVRDLERERAITAAIVDGVTDGVLVVNARDHLLLLNPSVRALFGLRPGEAEGKPFLDAIRNADLYELLEACRQAGGRPVSLELRLTTPAERTLEARALALRLGSEGTGVVVVLQDVTELQRLPRGRAG
jgi:two-component system phosphate regulon sensor histidine kinase PhoR